MGAMVVTGGAGFIGAHLCRALVDAGHHVTAIDSLTPFYSPATKRDRVATLQDRDGFHLLTDDLVDPGPPAVEALRQADVVFHLAAQAGVRGSWGAGFDTYLDANVRATQRLLDLVTGDPSGGPGPRVVLASSSSVYGRPPGGADRPSREDDRPNPHSPYGATKLMAEHLLQAYGRSFGLEWTAVRLFSVYGPGQRPDMAVHRLCRAALDGHPFTMYGDGSARRDLTFVDDAVGALVAAATVPGAAGQVVNVAGGDPVALVDLVPAVEQAAGRPIAVMPAPGRAGDVQDTWGDIGAAARILGWAPTTDLATGLRAQIASEEAAGADSPARIGVGPA